jgi:phosphopantetheine--protein transferase-like protein
MAVACGVDIIYIPGVQKISRDEAMLKKFLDAAEIQNPSLEHLAGLIAAKEAFFKALGIMPKFRDVQITHDPSGKPQLKVPSLLKKYTSCDVSISHDGDYAVAFVVLEYENNCRYH